MLKESFGRGIRKNPRTGIINKSFERGIVKNRLSDWNDKQYLLRED